MALTPDLEARLVRNYPADWEDLDTKAVDMARVLAAEAVQNAGSGHPGAAMSLAPLAYTLYQRIMTVDPSDPTWVGRDRFILSAGHASLLQYIQLYYGGFGLELEDLKNLRSWGAKTPGHPEVHHTPGVEVTTGPLGQGLAMGVGMAMAARRERGLFDPEAPQGTSPFDHYIYVVAGDGDIQEGVTAETSSIAGTQQLGNLIVFWDDNRITIEDDTRIAFTEDVVARYKAYGWQTIEVASGDDIVAIEKAVKEAQADPSRPAFIRVSTVIGYPAPTKMNTGSCHGAALGQDEVDGVKEALGLTSSEPFDVDPALIEHTRKLVHRGADKHATWQKDFDAWAQANPANKKLFDRLYSGELPKGWDADLPSWEADPKGVATRKASQKFLDAVADKLPELWGGSADLAGSNNTTMTGAPSFGPEAISTGTWEANPYGRTLHFGIREFAMGAILNGIALHGPTRPYGGTFLIFSDYMRAAVRLGALQKTSSIFVWTHDSIGLGEDGPTHQPVETLASLRAIPQLSIVRPADANETIQAWAAIIERPDSPAGIILTRQNVPVLEGTQQKAHDGVRKGGYVLVEGSKQTPDVILMGSGSEVQLAVAAAEQLEAQGVATRVVSMPCLEWFEAQDAEYRESVLPAAVKARVSVEAGIALPWYKYTGDHGRNVSLEHFGASAPAAELFERFGITTEAVVAAAHEALHS